MRDGIKGVMNPCDKNAIEMAITLKEKHGSNITLVSMGPQDVENTLTHGLAMGADQAVLICDKGLAGADTLATAFVLATAIKKLQEVQLVVCGKETADSGTQHVGPQIAHCLGMTQVTSIVDLSVQGNTFSARRQLKDEYETVQSELPVLVTVVKGINEPRMPTYLDIYEAAKKEIFHWCVPDLGIEDHQVGLQGSPTKIMNVFPPEASRECKILKGPVKEVSWRLVNELKNKDFI